MSVEDDLVEPFREQLLSIYETRRDIEEIDLALADAAACQRFRALRKLEVIYTMVLIKMIEDHGESLRLQFQAILRDS